MNANKTKTKTSLKVKIYENEWKGQEIQRMKTEGTKSWSLERYAK